MRKSCVIVDGYKFSKIYAATCRQKGMDCIYVQSTPSPLENFNNKSTYQSRDYIAHFIFNGDLEALLATLSHFDIACVIPATEPGVLLADTLADRLGTVSNDVTLSLEKRNKYAMVNALKKHGLATVAHCKTHDFDILHDWVVSNNRWPVVLKPLESSCSDNVFICTSVDTLRNAFISIKGKVNIHQEVNNEVLCQEYIDGDEYIVNTVSCQGRHYVTDICAVTKQSLDQHYKIYDTETLIAFNGKIQNALVDYVCKTLDALGIRVGAAHTEVMYTPDRGPILIETAGRVSGCINQKAHILCLKRDPFEIIIDSYVDPDRFFEKTKQPYAIHQHTMQIALCCESSGTLVDIPLLAHLEHFPSFYAVTMLVKPGDRVNKTVNLYDIPGKVTLIHPEKNRMESDAAAIKNLQKTGFEIIEQEQMPATAN